MGLLAELRETAAKINPKELFTEDKEQAARAFRSNLINQGARLFDESYSRYHGLGTLLESDDPREQYKAALTLNMLAKTEALIEGYKSTYGEAVVQTSLGALTPRILDVVRIFYPNQVLTMLADVQPMDGQVGSIFVLKPRFSNTLPAGTIGAVTAGQEIFKNQTYYYASEVVGHVLGTGTGASPGPFAATLGHLPIRKNSVTVTTLVGAAVITAVDNGAGGWTGTGVSAGSINYATGAATITYTGNPVNGAQVIATYSWDSEAAGDTINEIEFDMSVIPVQAKIHPLRFRYSVAAGLAAQAHLAVDVQDTMAELAGQFMKQERDNWGIKLIFDSAPAITALNFNATAPTNYDRQSLYADIELKLNEAESQIQIANGRGGVSWLIAGSNAANIFRNCKGFEPVPTVAPIGAHLIGYLRDRTVPVIKTIYGAMSADDYVVGYKGYMAGDAALVLAEWIPIYFTPVWQAPSLQNQQGLMSMYDMFVNNNKYFARGVISNYTA